jgi:PST family polysaccharide transporter
MLPLRQLNGPAGSVAVPALSRTQDDPERFARYYLRTINLVLWISAPVFGFLFVAAKPVIVLVLGKQWQEAAPVFKILAICALAQLLFGSTTWLFVSRGRSQQLLKLWLIIAPVIVGSYAIGLPFGIKGVALSGSLVSLVILPWTLKFAYRGTNLTLQGAGRALLYPVALCLVGVFLAELALSLISAERTFSQLLVVALSFAAVYSLSSLIPPVREEMLSLRKLWSELRLSSRSVQPTA